MYSSSLLHRRIPRSWSDGEGEELEKKRHELQNEKKHWNMKSIARMFLSVELFQILFIFEIEALFVWSRTFICCWTRWTWQKAFRKSGFKNEQIWCIRNGKNRVHKHFHSFWKRADKQNYKQNHSKMIYQLWQCYFLGDEQWMNEIFSFGTRAFARFLWT